jgi:guanosine-3',5'-bis(diphosphate) 3'-pyrophosphohydrolase
MTTSQYQQLVGKIREYNPKANFKLIDKAYQLALEAHHGQKRLSGEPVVNHPLAVAAILAGWKLDSVSIAAGLLHDVVEDSEISLDQLEKKFGQEVADLVDGVTKIGEIKLRASGEEKFLENLRKMLVVMARDLRVVLIKLADRLHNMKTLSYLPKEKQERIAQETLEIYAPLAERLGIGETKGLLEDLAFPYCYPDDYCEVYILAAPYYLQAEENIKLAKEIILKELQKQGVKAEVHGRAKHLYSLWQKLCRPEINQDITKVYDLIALRILVEEVQACYLALGLVHQLWKPVPAEGVSDFIAQPKPNGYRSIHTKVFGPKGKMMEVQIRTFEMHEQAENGIAAHWHYAYQKGRGTSSLQLDEGFFSPNEKMSWVNQLVAWQKEIVDSQEFLRTLKFDALSHRIFVFSPKGDVFDLPLGATPIDFAYAVHTDLGVQCTGAKVDGKLVPLDYHLKSGQVVEIVRNRNKKQPSRDWLNFVITRTARSEIAKQLRRD